MAIQELCSGSENKPMSEKPIWITEADVVGSSAGDLSACSAVDRVAFGLAAAAALRSTIGQPIVNIS